MNSIDRMHDQIIGSIVGLAVGDALGAPVEGWSARQISRRFGTLRNYVDTGRLPGAYTDDAQQALCIVDLLLEEGSFDPGALGRKFVELAQPIAPPTPQSWGELSKAVRGRYFGAFRGPGPGFRDSVRALQRGFSWRESGTLSAGNGTAMRVGPLGAFYHSRRFVDFRSAAFASAWITHTDPRALAGAFMIAYSVIHAINQEDDFHPEVYLRDLHAAVQDAEKAVQRQYWHPNLGVDRETCRHVSAAIRRMGRWLWRDTNEAIEAITRYAQRRTALPTHALSSFVLGSGIVAVYLFAKHSEDLEEALVIAINLGGDADSIGAMVGTMAGALHGYSAIPARWREGLRNHDAIYARAEALAHGAGMPADAPSLREMEVALTLEEASRPGRT